MLLALFFSQVYRPRRLIGCAQSTLAHYAVLLRHLDRFLHRPALLSDLNEEILSAFLLWFCEGRSLITVQKERSRLLALAGYAQKKGLLSAVPDVMTIRAYSRVPEAYSKEQIARLVAAAREMSGEICGIPASLFFVALFLVAYDTAARSGAIWSLAWTDYRPDLPGLLFRAEVQKQKADQLLKISEQTREAILRIRRPIFPRIFMWPLSESMRYYWVRKILKLAGLPHGRRDQLQRIRRTSLTMFHNLGGDATRQAGHSTDAVTRKHYLDPSQQVHAADVLPRPIFPDDRQLRLF